MNFGQNLQFLRKMHNGMTQEELAEKMNVSRQTISKWELGSVYPEIEKIIELCRYFSCSMDNLILDKINFDSRNYSDIRIEEIKEFRYVKYTVISSKPEDDGIRHIKDWAVSRGIDNPEIIGWDFPYLSQEQINVYNMHGYTAACILPKNFKVKESNIEVIAQKNKKYAIITIKNPFSSPFTLIPNAYKTLMEYIKINNIKENKDKEYLGCYEKEYEKDGVCYMDVCIAVDI